MRISAVYTTQRFQTESVTSGGQRQEQIRQAKDSYNRNAADKQVIDAEYVELYTPEKSILQRERHRLDLTLESQPKEKNLPLKSYPVINSPASKYQQVPLDTPAPGTYLNVFA